MCVNEESAPSRLLNFKTNRNVNYACGVVNSQVDFTNYEPLVNLRPFDEFKASDFYITVLKAEGANGVFSGSGVTSFPYLEMIQFQVEFRNININTDYQMTAGEVVFVYNEKSSLIASVGGGGETASQEEIPFSLDDAINQITDNSVVYDSNVSDISVSGNTVNVTLEDGTTQTIPVNNGETVGIVTPDGGYVVDTSSGQVFEIPNTPPGSAHNVLPPSQTNSYDCITSFKPAVNHRFGFDQVGDGNIKPNQYFLKDKTGNNIHWKSLEAGSNDYLIVTASGNCPTDSLRFIRETGIATGVSKQGGSNALNLLVAGGMDGTEEILSVARASTVKVNDTTSHEILTETGALGLVSYTRLHKTVVLIPVNSATLPTNTTGIQQRLNELYAPAIVEWTVKTDQRLEVTRIEEGDFKTTGLSMASKYTGDMRKVINAYEKTQEAQANTVYLFFLNVPDSELEGFMPLTGQYGFIFNYKGNPDLMAHELAHGTFNLRHTFSNKAQYIFDKGDTKNLLDYSNSTELWKYQWDLIHDPQRVLFAWGQSEEEGAMSLFKSNLSLVYYNDSGLVHNQTIYFLPEINEEITLKAKQTKNDVKEDVKVNWSCEDQKEIAEITFTANSEFFSDADKIQIDVTEKVLLGADSTLTYFVGKIDVSPATVIDSILTNIKDIREEFDSLVQVVSELQAENYDGISLQATSK